MHYLVDGHNLIPKLGLRLESMDDEMELVAILQEFCRLGRHQVEVYFDGAPAPHAGTRKLGTVTAHFVLLGKTADNAIRDRVRKMGRSAKTLTIVSSDRQVQADARAAQSEVISSDAFVGTLKHARGAAPKPTNERKLSSQEIEEWLEMFQERKHK
jgi:predicted RNA-binding protein with PIN domain